MKEKSPPDFDFRRLVSWLQRRPAAPSEPTEKIEETPALPAGRWLEKRAPDFRARLGKRPLVEGWSHNPWQAKTVPDAVATKIADHYIGYFTQALMDYGYLPFTGTEVNFGIRSEQEDPQGHALIGYSDLRKALHEHAKSFYPEKRPIPYLDSRLLSDNEFHGRAYIDGNMQVAGRKGTEFEISSPALSPSATVVRTRGTKRTAYEATQHYAHLFAQSAEGQDPEAIVPAGQAADFLARQMGPTDIFFADRTSPTGEHLSFSLLRRDDQHITDYEHARRHSVLFNALSRFNEKTPVRFSSEAFGQANLIRYRYWARLLRQTFEDYLANDELLAFGHHEKFSLLNHDANEKGTKHHIRWHTSGHGKEEDDHSASSPETARLEIRSFNDASSNLSLSMLAGLAAMYAAVKTLHRNLGVPTKMAQHSLNAQDLALVREQLGFAVTPNPIVCRSLDEAKERFQSDSLTLAMMEDFVEEYIKDPAEKTRMRKEIETFTQAVMARADIIQENTKTADFAR